MEKFTNVMNKQDNFEQKQDIVYTNNEFTVKNINNINYIDELDKIYILPYAKDEGYIFFNVEENMIWDKKLNEQNIKYLTALNTLINNNENPQTAIKRILYSNAGIVINHFYEFDISDPLFITNNNTSQYYICFMELNINDFKIVSSPIKLKNEKQIVRISIADIDNIKINDIPTMLLIDKLKNTYKL